MSGRKGARRDGAAASRGQRGITLIELLVMIGFMSSFAALISTSFFQSIKADRLTSQSIGVSDQVARATRWIVNDGHRAQSTDVVDGAAPVETATLNWTEAGAPVSCTLGTNEAQLVRTCGGQASTIGKGISDLEFSRSGELLTVSFLVTSGQQTQDVSMNVLLGGR